MSRQSSQEDKHLNAKPTVCWSWYVNKDKEWKTEQQMSVYLSNHIKNTKTALRCHSDSEIEP